MVYDFFLIALICVGIIDMSGIIESGNEYLKRLTGKPYRIPKPFSCSLCMTWWLCLIWSIIFNFSLGNIALSLIFALLTPVMYDLLTVARDVLSRVIYLIATFFQL